MRRSRLSSISAALVLAVLLVGAACTPPGTGPSGPPPVPNGIGVQWLRDAGGTTDTGTGIYSPAWGSYVILNGATTGPTAPLFTLAPPMLVSALGHSYPDGTAKFPWNGYSGEGITVASGPGMGVTVTHPGGACTISGTIAAVSPSPDGTKAVSLSSDSFAGTTFTGVTTHTLTPSGACTSISSSPTYTKTGSGGDIVSNQTFVWDPASTAVLYQLTPTAAGPATIVRLDASSGATPTTLLPASGGCTLPLGWSITNRILLSCLQISGSDIYSQLSTMHVGGGAWNPVDSFSYTSVTSKYVNGHYGYFIPGQDFIVFNRAVPVTNSDGHVMPWYQVQIKTDVPGGFPGPLTGTAPPFGWHQETVGSSPFPPFTFTDVPNQELLGRFTH